MGDAGRERVGEVGRESGRGREREWERQGERESGRVGDAGRENGRSREREWEM